VHAMWSAGELPARVAEVLTPAGSERWFEELAGLARADTEGFEATCRRYGIQFLRDSPWLDQLRQRFQLL
jgi:hypothetical protein